MTTLSGDELRRLSKSLIEDPALAYDMSHDQLNQVRKFINPYGNIISANESWVNLSIINWRDEYLRKFHMTGLVGYLYRTLEEYEDEDDIDVVRAKWNKKIKEQKDFNQQLILNGVPQDTLDGSVSKLSKQMDDEIKMRKTITRNIARRFLNRNFDYNPDKHLRGSHSSNDKDPERKTKPEVVRENMATGDKAPMVEQRIKDNPDAVFKYLKDNLMYTYQSAIQSMDVIKGALKSLQNSENDIDDKMGILGRKYNQLTKITTDMKKLVDPLAAAEMVSAIKVNPPTEVFFHYNRYMTNHYEQLREVCQNLFNEKPDLEFSVIYYDHFKNQNKARDHRIMHADEFRAEVLSLSNNGISMIGPFRENRERVDFYNKNTEIMKRMMEQMEADNKLGKDLIDKRMKEKKTKNIKEDGPDDPGLASYTKTGHGGGGTAQDLGAKKGMTKAEQEAAYAAQIKDEQDKLDPEAIQVEVFYPQENADGETEVKRTYFETQAEAPLHLQEGSSFSTHYQPKRDKNMTIRSSISSKIITDKHGNQIEVKELSDKIKDKK